MMQLVGSVGQAGTGCFGGLGALQGFGIGAVPQRVAAPTQPSDVGRLAVIEVGGSDLSSRDPALFAGIWSYQKSFLESAIDSDRSANGHPDSIRISQSPLARVFNVLLGALGAILGDRFRMIGAPAIMGQPIALLIGLAPSVDRRSTSFGVIGSPLPGAGVVTSPAIGPPLVAGPVSSDCELIDRLGELAGGADFGYPCSTLTLHRDNPLVSRGATGRDVSASPPLRASPNFTRKGGA